MQKPYTRHSRGQGVKRQLIGNQARQVPPAWGTNNIPTDQTTPASTKEKRSISGLQTDVREKEVEVGSCVLPNCYELLNSPSLEVTTVRIRHMKGR